MAAEVRELRVELGIEPVGMQNCRLEVVNDERTGHAPEILKRVLNALEEGVGGLREDRLAVCLARVRQHDPEDVRASSAAVRADDRGAGAEVDLRFVSRRALHPPKRRR